MILAHDYYPATLTTAADSREVVYLHGIMGSRQNWRSFAQLHQRHRPQDSLLLCDLRGHGDSRWIQDKATSTVVQCAKDILETCTSLHLTPHTFVGHSFSSKVILAYARMGLPCEHLWVLDATTGTMSFDEKAETVRVLRAAQRMPVPMHRRSDVIQYFIEQGFSKEIGLWMTTNVTDRDALHSAENGLTWRLNLSIVEMLLQDFCTEDFTKFLSLPRSHPRISIIKAEKSARISFEEIDRYHRWSESSDLSFYEMPGVDHWLHTQDPVGLWELIRKGL